MNGIGYWISGIIYTGGVAETLKGEGWYLKRRPCTRAPASHGYRAKSASAVPAMRMSAGWTRPIDRKSTRLNSSHKVQSRMPSSA